MVSRNGFRSVALVRGALLSLVFGVVAVSAARANDPWAVAQREASPSPNLARQDWMPSSRQAAGLREDRDSAGPFNPTRGDPQPDADAVSVPADDTPPAHAPSDR